MEKNKSIDGLRPRRARKVPVKQTPKKSNKSKTIKKVAVQKTSPKKPSSIKTPVKPRKKINVATTEDFLKPVQAFDFDEDSGTLKESTKQKLQKPKKDKKKMSKKRKISLGVIAILSIIVIGIIWLVLWGNGIIAKITGGQGNVFDLLFHDETYVELKTDENGRTNILAIGTSGYNMDGDEGNGTHDGAQLTDSIMIISLNQKTGDVAMLSLPRDLKVSRTCTATGKINEIYWCNGGGGEASVEEEAKANQALMDEVGEILNLDFHYFAHLNWGSLIQIVDTLGGIKVTLDEDIPDYYNTGYSYQAGVEYDIDGYQAMVLSRARYGTSGGDFTRSASQQRILIGLKDRIFEKKLSIADIISLASTLGDNIRTNFSIDEIKALAHLTYEFNFDNIRQISLIEPEKLLTTGLINGISYVLPTSGANNYNRIHAFIAKMLNNDPRVYEEPSILVLNASNDPETATKEKSALEESGYTNVATDTSPISTDERYTIYTLTDKPGTRKLLESYYKTSSLSAEEVPSELPTGYDFIVLLGPQ